MMIFRRASIGALAGGALFLLASMIGAPGASAAPSIKTILDLDKLESGAFGQGILIVGSTIYGTASVGSFGGFVFLSTEGGAANIIWSFDGDSKGGAPNYDLARDRAGVLYGTTSNGGTMACSCGVVFAVTPHGVGKGSLTLLHIFTGHGDGSIPAAGPTFAEANDTALYGTTGGGGDHCQPGCGTVWRIPRAGSKWGKKTILYDFKGGKDGNGPISRLVAYQAGNLYGTTLEGGSSVACGTAGTIGCGTVYKLTRKGTGYTESVIYSFKGGSDGAQPYGDVTVGPGGVIYGTTFGDDSRTDFGTVYRLKPQGAKYVETVLYRFKGHKDGAGPLAGVHLQPNAELVGTTSSGGQVGDRLPGTVYVLKPAAGNALWTEIARVSPKGGVNGAVPQSNIVADAHGRLFSTNFGDDSQFQDHATLFEFTP